jgi:photosystem II stability/assembly factor-like uncharacterized protein
MKWTALRGFVFALALVSCTGPTGPQGPAGTNGTSGTSDPRKWILVGNPSNSAQPGAIIWGASGNYLLATPALGISRSSDNGATWAPTEFPDSFQVRALTVSNGKIFAGGCPFKTGAGESCGIYVSSDSGATWKPTGFQGTSEIRSIAVDGDSILAGQSPGFSRSSDNGATWSPIDLPDSAQAAVTAIAVSGSTILAAVSGYGIYGSSDNGKTWKQPLSQECFTTAAISVSAAKVMAACGSGVYRSSDSGATWTRIFAGRVVAVGTIGQSIFVGMALDVAAGAGGVAYSLDDGATWAQAGEGLSGVACSSVVAANDFLFATDFWANIWRLPLSAL